MLVLSRKPGERILIGDDITLTIVKIGPNTVKVGIDAPRSTNIVREELCEMELEIVIDSDGVIAEDVIPKSAKQRQVG